MLVRKLRYTCDILGGENSTRGVVRTDQDDEPRPRSYQRTQLFKVESKVQFFSEVQRDRSCARETYRGLEHGKKWGWVDGLIAFLKQRKHREEDEGLGSRAHKDAIWRDVQAASLLEFAGYLLAERDYALRVTVLGEAVGNGLSACLTDVRRCFEAGFPDLQVDNINALSLKGLSACEDHKRRICGQASNPAGDSHAGSGLLC